MNHFDAVIIGGGACGLMCAVQAGYLGKKTLVLERNDRLGAKILISGGGVVTIPICIPKQKISFPITRTSANRHFHNGQLPIHSVFLKLMVLKGQRKP